MKYSQCITLRARARSLEGVAEGIDRNDPAALLMAQEDAREQPVTIERSDVAALLMGHLFGASPHPERVTLRLYQLTQEIAPELLIGLPYAERLMLTAESEAAQDERVRALLRGTRIRRRHPQRHQRVIREILAGAWAKHRDMLLLTSEVPLAVLTDYQVDRSDESLAEFRERRETLITLLQFFFLDGVAPEHAVKRVFMIAKAYFEPLVLRMSLQQLAEMFGQVRATWSWRGKNKLSGFLASRGVTAVKAPYQKSEAVCVKYAAAAAGNHNRATGRRVA